MTNLNALQTMLVAKIANVRRAERVTKVRLSELSRELLDYVLLDSGTLIDSLPQGSMDIGMVNRLLGVLTPANRKVAFSFFKHFLPFSADVEAHSFKKLQRKHLEKKVALVVDFLNNPQNDIWEWVEQNIEVEAKEVDYAERVTKAVTKAVKEEVSKADILKALFAGGVTIADVFEELGLVEAPAPATLEEQIKEALV